VFDGVNIGRIHSRLRRVTIWQCSLMPNYFVDTGLCMFSGLRDLNVFCNETELHLLCMLLDINDTGHIDYSFIATGLSYIRWLILR